MKRIIYLATAALVAMMVLVPTAAMAQEDTVPGDDDPLVPEKGVVEVGSLEEIPAKEPLPTTGGPAAIGLVLLPAAALLLGSGVIAYAVLRRRR